VSAPTDLPRSPSPGFGPPAAHPVRETDALGDRVRRRTMWHIVPYLLLLYFVAYLDRVNIGYAALAMRHDLALGPDQYAFGAGIFFVGYFLFEIPGSILVETWSARGWLARILITWGLIASAMALMRTPTHFYWLRFLLGAAEAGFFPGVVVYLSHWFRVEDRSRAFAMFMFAVPVSNIVGAPLSGLLLGVDWGGVAGWRWLFLLEGLPAVVLGVVTLYVLTDRPRDARWLRDDERAWLLDALARESARTTAAPGWRAGARALARPQIVLLVLAYFGIVTTSYGFSLWMPTIVKGLTGLSNMTVTLIATIPYVSGGLVTLVVGWSSDRTGERRWHTMTPMLMAAAGLALAILLPGTASSYWGIVSLALVGGGIYGFMPSFWALPRWFTSGATGAAAIGLINSTGCLGGFVGPFLIGQSQTRFGDYSHGLGALALTAGFAAAMIFLVRRPRD
jgi:ACS family tartrate transporter-like MFS transporter